MDFVVYVAFVFETFLESRSFFLQKLSIPFTLMTQFVKAVSQQEFGDNMKILGEGFRKATLQTEYEKAGRLVSFYKTAFWEGEIPLDLEWM